MMAKGWREAAAERRMVSKPATIRLEVTTLLTLVVAAFVAGLLTGLFA